MLPALPMQGIKPPLGARLDPMHPFSAAMLHWFPFNEGGGQAIYDIVRGRIGPMTAMESTDWGDGALGKYLEFGGTDETIQITSITGLGPTISIVLRFRLMATGIAQTLLSWSTAGDSNDGWRISINSASNRLFWIFGGVATYDLTGFTALTTGQDYELALSCTGSGGTVYAALKRGPGAGIEVSGPHSVGTMGGSPSVLNIGRTGFFSPEFAQFRLSDLQFLGRVLSVNEQIDAILHPYGNAVRPRLTLGPPRRAAKAAAAGGGAASIAPHMTYYRKRRAA